MFERELGWQFADVCAWYVVVTGCQCSLINCNFTVCVVCGKPYNDRTLIVGGSETKKGDYPWQVALYRATDKELLCGGSLLNQRVIVTG